MLIKKQNEALSENQRKLRVKKCRALRSRFAENDCQRILFSDEKIFTVEQQLNAQNDRVYANNITQVPDKVRTVYKSQHPEYVMVWAGVSGQGKTKLFFVEPGAKIDAKYYLEKILKGPVKNCSQTIFQNQSWTFQQDSAPAHKARISVDFCRENLPDFISPQEWPAASPDLNPMDYSMWGILEGQIGNKKYASVAQLRAALIREWDNISLETLRKICGSWRNRLKLCINSKGNRFE